MNMNKIQRDYAIAKAAAEAADMQQVENEKQFLTESGIKNSDGSTPTAIWLINDENDFLRLSEAWEKSPLNQIEVVRESWAVLETAEDALIDWALSIIPVGVSKTLNAHRRDYSTRRKILDLAFNLDISTVKTNK